MKDINELYKNEGYILEELLASDSWGELYRGVYLPHQRQLLFRRFTSGLAEQAPWELAAAEIQAWARIDHPAVLQPLDWGNPPVGPYLATELPDGLPLAAMVQEAGGVVEPAPDRIFAGLLEAVEAARRWGVLHLGLGLTNVWVDGSGAVKLSEFGLWYVRAEFPELASLETPFLAPEQRQGKATAATDVYALGALFVVLHRGIAGLVLDAGEEARAVLEFPDGVQSAVSRCLDANPLARPRSAGELALTLGISTCDEPPHSYRDCPICKLKEEIARDRGLRPRSATDRLRAFIQGSADASRDISTPTAGASGSPAERSRPGDEIDSLFPWIVIAALALATLGVWILAFR
ncbi:MAG: hypothetical protein CVT63_04075 [Candidatus Anoxymicrobium japonicum]|uniref:non-specific serine/threonine protein kinase n=1 Tax=Candidatus Anoxymicrobium japonicum TaxID=2013648 RepID=A0A2N3G636_9ACTN|nr:MAG: hypothetical protein CVT63_04075 [Candidatus Anoxymicrobium japonicum]